MTSLGTEIKWVECVPLQPQSCCPRPRSFASLTSVDARFLILVGGIGAIDGAPQREQGRESTGDANECIMSDLWVFDVTWSSTWTQLCVGKARDDCQVRAAMTRSHHKSCFVDGRLYIFGGQATEGVGGGATTKYLRDVVIVENIFFTSASGVSINEHPTFTIVSPPADICAMTYFEMQVIHRYTPEDASSELVAVCYGGHDGRFLLDGLFFFSFQRRQWLTSSDMARNASSPILGDRSAACLGLLLPEPCHRHVESDTFLSQLPCSSCGAIDQTCAHQSKACSYGLLNKRMSALPSVCGGAGASLPPRSGHTLTVVPRIVDHSGDDSAGAELLLFGGEVGLSVFNTMYKIEIARDSSTAKWTALTGGDEQRKPRAAGAVHIPCLAPAPPLVATLPLATLPQAARGGHSSKSQLPHSAGEVPPFSASVSQEVDSPPPKSVDKILQSDLGSKLGGLQLRTDEGTLLLQVSESPPRQEHCCSSVLSANNAPHCAFHCAWPAGSNGLLVYGGMNVANSTFHSTMYFFDRIRNAWFDVKNPLSPVSPGCRIGSAACTVWVLDDAQGEQAGSSGGMRCGRCGAAGEERHFMFGGDGFDGSKKGDLWTFEMHYTGCSQLSRSPLSRAVPELTPPPRSSVRRHELLKPGAERFPQPDFLCATNVQLPLKMLTARLILHHYEHFSQFLVITPTEKTIE